MRLSEYRAHAELRALLHRADRYCDARVAFKTGHAPEFADEAETRHAQRRVRPYLLLRAAAARAEREAIAASW